LAKLFGFTGEPTQPGGYDWEKETTFVWSDAESAFEIDASRLFSQFLYEHYPQTGNIPTDEEAIKTATQFLKSRNLYPSNIVDVQMRPLRIYLFDDMKYKNDPKYNTQVDTKTVYFSKQVNGIPLAVGLVGIDYFGSIMVAVGPGNQVVEMFDPQYGYNIVQTDNMKYTIKPRMKQFRNLKQQEEQLVWLKLLQEKVGLQTKNSKLEMH